MVLSKSDRELQEPGKTFNTALYEAVERRHQWQRPIAIWVTGNFNGDGDLTGIEFDARADTIPGPTPDSEVMLRLGDDDLANLAGTLDESEDAFDALVTDILSDLENRR